MNNYIPLRHYWLQTSFSPQQRAKTGPVPSNLKHNLNVLSSQGHFSKSIPYHLNSSLIFSVFKFLNFRYTSQLKVKEFLDHNHMWKCLKMAFFVFATISFSTICPKNLNLGLGHHAPTLALRVKTVHGKTNVSEGKECHTTKASKSNPFSAFLVFAYISFSTILPKNLNLGLGHHAPTLSGDGGVDCQ